jgi:hypothetical protein
LHDGTLVIEFDDIGTGALVRDEGTPVIAKHLPALPGLPADRRGGQADFHTSFVTGIVMPSLQVDDFPEFFQFFATGEALIVPIALPSMGVSAGLLSIASFIALARLAARTDSKRRGTREERY